MHFNKIFLCLVIIVIATNNALANFSKKSEFLEKIKELDQSLEIENIKKIENTNLYLVSKNNTKLYFDENLKYFFSGDIVLFDENLKPKKVKGFNPNSSKNKQWFLENKKNAISYISKNEKMEVFALVDYTCPFCKKLHSDIEKINKSGISLYFFPISRNKGASDVLNGLVKIWCSKNQKENLDIGYKTKNMSNIELKSCENREEYIKLLKNVYNIADNNEIKGTPALFTNSGFLINGYTNFEDFYTQVLKNSDIKEE